jgi:predicted Zn-dependent protease
VNPDSPDAAVDLGQLLAASGQVDEASALLKQVLAKDPKNIAAQSGLIDILVAKGDLPAAETQARALDALDDPRGLGALQLGQVLRQKNDLAGAKPAFERALKKSPQSLQALEGLVLTLTQQGKLAEGEAFLRGYLRENPEQWNAEILLGGNLLRQGKFAEAQQVLKPVLAEHPKAVRGWVTLAGAYPQDLKGRIAVLKDGVKAMPKNQDITLLLATAYEQAGNIPEAIATYEQLLKDNPRADLAANNLAALLLDSRPDPETAQRALELTQPFTDSRNPQYLDTLGWANYRKGDMASAVKFLELAIAFGGDNPIVRYHLGMAYLASDNPVGAKQELEKAIAQGKDQFPGAKEAQAALDKLNKPPT